ncbi:MAG: polyprenyl synthetase family protein [Acidimicrobiaceae bacterium]|nr:polyprenyl synthetase family protein [Acidimicrobiaceae bacterium]
MTAHDDQRVEPPAELAAIAARVQIRLGEILAAERQEWAALDPSLDEPLGDLADMVLGGGKRIRPAYCHWGWLAAGGDPSGDGALDGGCALEILHAFALAHDDVMDGSVTRRGAPTVWSKFVQRHRDRAWRGEDRRFGEAAAVLVGDMAMVLADRTLGRVSQEARDVWDGLRTELNMGQYLDVVGGARGRATADEARRIIEHKTARYTVVRPLQLGAALAGRADLAEPLAGHGRPVGLAFQLRDDVLGAFGDPAATGKPVGDDLREGKPTVLMALARDAATPVQLKVLDAVGAELDDQTVAEVQQVIVDTGALAGLESEIAALLDEALAALDALPDVPAAQDALAATARFIALRQA